MNRKHVQNSILFYLLILTLYIMGNMTCSYPEEAQFKSLPEIEPEGEVARIIIFSEPTCEECQELKSKILPKLFKQYPDQIACRIYEIDSVPNFLLLERFEKKYGKAENEVPILFMDEKVRSGLEEEVKKHLEEDIKASLAHGGNPWAEPAPEDLSSSNTEKISKKLDSLTLLAVIGAGLSDGINPCAFSTIIFLISYLSILGRKKKEILMMGIFYTFAVFLTYLGLGFGLMSLVQHIINNISLASKILYGVTACIAFVVAFFSFRDYTLAKKGRLKDMTLKLSDNMQKRIHKSIHSKVRNLGIVSAAVVLGALVALFELPCTGQVYLPIVTALSDPALRPKALPYLILYNFMFVIPLIVVFLVTYFGISSENIGERFKRNIGTIKILMGFMFVILGGILIYLAIK
jgi:cytochrome c biogenesis protein CcdA